MSSSSFQCCRSDHSDRSDPRASCSSSTLLPATKHTTHDSTCIHFLGNAHIKYTSKSTATDSTYWKFKKINDCVAFEIAGKIRNSTTVWSLDILGPSRIYNFDSLTIVGAKAILEAVSNHQHLRILDLLGNKGLGDAIAPAICEMLTRNSSLHHLNLLNCGLTDASIDSLVEGILCNSTLKTLRLGSRLTNSLNTISDSGMQKLRDAASIRGIALEIN